MPVAQADIRRWTKRGYTAARRAYGLAESQFWPKGRKGQKYATTWAWGIFLSAVTDGNNQFLPANGTHMFAASMGDKHCNNKLGVTASLWNGPGVAVPPNVTRETDYRETMLDLTVQDWGAPSPFLATCESEMCATWGVGDDIDGVNDYSWDFFKLLAVPSPFRLFIGRVGPDGGIAGEERRDALVHSLKAVHDRYPVLRGGGEMAAVLLTDRDAANEWRDSRYVIFGSNGTPHQDGLIWPTDNDW